LLQRFSTAVIDIDHDVLLPN